MSDRWAVLKPKQVKPDLDMVFDSEMEARQFCFRDCFDLQAIQAMQAVGWRVKKLREDTQ